MVLAQAFFQYGVKLVLYTAVVALGITAGIFLRKKKDNK